MPAGAGIFLLGDSAKSCWGVFHLDGEGFAFGEFEVGMEDEIVGVVCAIGGGVAIQIVGYELGFNP